MGCWTRVFGDHGRYTLIQRCCRAGSLDVTGDDPVITAKIALAHLREFPDYYDRLEAMEREAEAAWESED
jgi:hypothetical protein